MDVAEPPKRGIGGLLALAGTLAFAFLVFRFTPLSELLTREVLLQGLEQVRESSWGPLLFVAGYAIATALALPGTVFTLVGGAVFGLGWGLLWNSLGANLGATLAFLLARALGKDELVRLLGRRADSLDRATQEYGFRALFTLRLIPLVPFNVLNFAGGLAGMRWSSYALATVIGILPGTAVYTYFADALLQGSQDASREALVRVAIAGLLLILLSLVPTIVKKIMGRRAAVGVGALLLGLSADTTPVAAQLMSAVGHEPFSEVLASVVSPPLVDYARLKEERAALDSYLGNLGNFDRAALVGASREERLAFWINAYNACMLKRVVDHYPIDRSSSLLNRLRNRVADRPANSVWQIDGVFTEPHCRVAGELRSQDQIEHEILRPMGDPRIHFVVNCAARSCPPLGAHAFSAATVDQDLDAAIQAFVDDPGHFQLVDGASPVLRLNQVLEWYGEDFGGENGLRTFFKRFVQPEQAERLDRQDLRVEYFEYDWTLNDVRR